MAETPTANMDAKMQTQKVKMTAPPNCPNCGKQKILRKSAKSKTVGKEFWGYTGYPECKGVANIV